ncbi:MAG TPA: flagellar biosynthetic protein FliO [Actinophytocola sp.]|uniref:flagellar biosynthetic protein FliO n=1 Tax=Actinophytocola sp. TaxID=1872138 RepID=UPI002DB72A6A|nr:flagellar biosynthetic protein FliO [Actinophytocola sp.]HEU5474226.1 flagellar biosynthetic protein FliO [Actinophytocola sp.]
MEAILRVVIALVLVIGVMWVLAKLARRPLRGKAAGALDVVARTQLSRHASVAVVKIDDTALVLGVTDHGISLLHETGADAFAVEAPTRRTAVDLDAVRARKSSAAPAAGSPLTGSALSMKTWKQAFETMKERSVRKA